MKKIIALLMVCGFAMAFVACGGKTETTESTEAATEAVDTTAAPAADTTATDTTAAPAAQ